MDRKCGDTNYEEVNMDMSDSDGSDNEMFACKQEYNNFKQHFNAKSEKGKTTSEYGVKTNSEYGGSGVKPIESVSEYGGDDNRVAAVGNKFGHGGAEAVGRASDQGVIHNRNSVGGLKRPSLGQGERGGGGGGRLGDRAENHISSYGGRHVEERPRSRERRRSRSGDRKRRSKSREGRHGGRSRSREKRRSRSRGDRGSPRRDGGRGRGGWGRDRDRGRRDRDEQSRNMEDQVKKAKEMGVEMPKYFKPGAVNPLSYAEQVQKRKMMWSKPVSGGSGVSGGQCGVGAGGGGTVVAPVQAKPTPPPCQKTSFNKWEATNFGDEKANEKFRRLMGIKTPSNELATAPGAAPHANQDKIKEDLEKNYEVARQQTHRNRGLGLGFSNLEPTMPAEQYLPNPTPPPSSNPYLSYSQPKPAPGGMWPNRPAAGNINFVRKHH